MTKQRSIFYLVVYLIVLFTLRYLVGRAFPTLSSDGTALLFASGLLLVVLGVFVTEKHFTRSLDVVVNAITVIVVLDTVDVSHRFVLYSDLYAYAAVIGLLALLGFALAVEDADPAGIRQRTAAALYRVTSFLGGARMMFSIMFVLSIFEYLVAHVEQGQVISHQEVLILLMILFWGSTLLIEPIDRVVVAPLLLRFRQPHVACIGHVFKRFEPNLVMVAKAREIATPQFGELVAIHGASGALPGNIAMYLDDVDTDEGRFLQFYALGDHRAGNTPGTIVSTTTEGAALAALSGVGDALYLYKHRSRIVGTVATHSDIDVIRIRMLTGVDVKMKLTEGDLLSVSVYGKAIKYQVIGVTTEVETVSGQNKLGMKIISAQQIGEWNEPERKFVGANWVPDMNAIAMQEGERGEESAIPSTASFQVGVVPKSSFPIYLNFAETISHHLAIIGKTGTGKSQMAADIVRELATSGYKVVVLEVDSNHPQSLSRRIDSSLVSASTTSWTSKTEKRTKNGKSFDENVWTCDIDLNPADGRKVFLAGLDRAAGSTDGGPLSHSESAAAIIQRVLAHKIKPENKDDKICIVLEEAYDFIPESTFGSQDFGQPSVSRIAQLVLKCRKHEVGFLVITQRTALVSKTVLYQCNTIIALQTFDETSKNFMSAYISNKYLESMSILPRFRAIVVGKGSSCDKPIIVDFERRPAQVSSELPSVTAD